MASIPARSYLAVTTNGSMIRFRFFDFAHASIILQNRIGSSCGFKSRFLTFSRRCTEFKSQYTTALLISSFLRSVSLNASTINALESPRTLVVSKAMLSSEAPTANFGIFSSPSPSKRKCIFFTVTTAFARTTSKSAPKPTGFFFLLLLFFRVLPRLPSFLFLVDDITSVSFSGVCNGG